MRRALFGLCAFFVACGTSVANTGPKTNGPDVVWIPTRTAVQKVDLLFMIDNSASMGDKQDLLAQAVPDLVDRLLAPHCVLVDDPAETVPRAAGGACPAGAMDEFLPVHDMHVGIVTSSLGGGGSDVCDASAKLSPNEVPQLTNVSRHNDDRGHLINRTAPDRLNPPPTGIEDPVADALPNGFLAWLPPENPRNRVTTSPVPPLGDAPRFRTDFTQLVRGVQEFGCGLEAQMESWYRFLVQPDPYEALALSADPNGEPSRVSLVGVDADLLAQRADFLRPDSLLAVIVVTDEEDSWSDPMWQGGRGWLTRGQNNSFSKTGQLPRGTIACQAPVDPNDPTHTGPNSPECRWCTQPEAASDPNCQTNKGLYTDKEDGLNVRYTDDMKRRYGMNPQFPIARYVDGLKSTLVPDRFGEHFERDDAATPTATYLGRKNCTNPIYAQALPTDPNGELCHLARGPRTSDLVFLAVIGGVPWQLLTENRGNPSAPFKKALSDGDWTRILGKDPAHFHQEGIDPHMIESTTPRQGIACGAGAPATCDAFHGREWNTQTSKVGIDLEYACTFTLPKPKDCTKLPEGAACDCGGSFNGPLCEPNPSDGNNLTLQTRGKAYPTVRQLRVVKEMGDNGVAASLCPRTLDASDPDYGYRPAVRAVIDRMKPLLADRCLPKPLVVDKATGAAKCQVYVQMWTATDQATACDPSQGMRQPDAAFLATYPTSTYPWIGPERPPVCELVQLAHSDYAPRDSCENAGKPGWCYVEGPAAGTCPLGQERAIKFGAAPPDAPVIRCAAENP